jgi:hypothetical protein
LPKNIKRDRDLVENLKIEIPSSSHKRRKNMSFSCLFLKKSENSMQGMKRMLLQRSLPKDHKELMKITLYFSKLCAKYRVQLIEKSTFHILFKSK